jgi:phosphotransferase system enzyme I (PtsI)
MSFTLHGVGVGGGIAIGHAHLVSHETLDVLYFVLPSFLVPQEVERFDQAIAATRAEMESLRASIPASAPAELSAFLDLHLMILGDSTLSEAPKRMIEEQRCNAEWALKQQMEALIAQFESFDDAYLRERRHDVVQVVERVMKSLLGHPGQSPFEGGKAKENSILVAHDLSPADMILFKQNQFAAFITDVGGTTSHTAILARSLSIPSVVALHNARQLINEHDQIIVDGSQGVVIVNPDRAILDEYRLRQEQWELERQKLKRLKTAKATTLDGTHIELMANIELAEDIDQVKAHGAEGIGLFRSEFLFMNRDDLPSEDEQFEAYRKVAKAMKGLPVTVRTLDLGADKQPRFAVQTSDNPALGLRAIRLCLAEPQMFLTQLRAILRASHYGAIQILVPMLTSLGELNQTLALVERAKQSLKEEGIPFDEAIKLGGMIEVPAAALTVKSLAKKLDFLSIGTNDLIQYTLAIDRTDEAVAKLYDPLHPAVLKLVAATIHTGRMLGIPVAVCGEMAGDASLTRLLLGFGLREFSMHPAHLLAVKQQILKTNLPTAESLAQKVLKAWEPEKILALVAKLNEA